MPPAPTSVAAYLATQPAAARRALSQVRRTIKRALPMADEVISYGVPTYKIDGRAVIYFAAWRDHYSLYPSGQRLVDAFARRLVPYECEKGTIRFPLDRPVPTALITALAKFRAKERAHKTGAARSRRTGRI